ncbi:MAG: Mth938-like domain-containing protein [Amaricoccus sp.]|uniref:Mth938-like domain-containing protein n=1 Tax=Amaricoccus sp. TaxID=1872485 RepID=UPI0039E33E13
MRTFEVSFDGRIPVDGYGAGGFRVRGAVHVGPLALLPDGIVAWDGLPDLAPFLERAESFDVLLLGVGPSVGPLPERVAAARSALEARGPGVEVMATPSACRTYNVLLGEGRRVAAALMPI